ncbi:hypothetical protein [Bacillus mycoides]
MFYVLLQRLLKQWSFYIALGIGTILSIAYFWSFELPLHEDLKGTGGISFTPYTKWIGMDAGFSKYSTLYVFLLPIIATLPLSDLYAKDVRNGFIRFLLIRGEYKSYFLYLFILNFFTSMFVAIIPLFLNIYLSFMKLPDVIPDRVINNEMPLLSAYTFLPELYYTHPLLHMLMYVLLIGLFSSTFATVALGTGMFIHKSYIILMTPFGLQFVLTTFFGAIGHPEMSATSFLLEQAISGVHVLSMLTQLVVGLIIGLCIYIIGVKKNVIN